MSRIVWLASYPKSGNTWLRVFLSNFQRDDGQPVDIDKVDLGIVASARNLFDSALGVESSDMTAKEIDYYRPGVYRHLAAQSAETLYVKVHDAYGSTSAGDPLIPSAATSSTIYVARNPLDVAISFAHHLRESVARTIDRMSDETTSLSTNEGHLSTQLKQRLLSWSEHVSSWLDQRAIPVHLIRYEDMSHRPVETFASAVRFLGWEEDLDRVRRAVAFSSFEILREQESAHGFKEKRSGTESFFRQGRAGAWREVLTEAQVAQIVRDHGPVMRRLAYLSADGCIPDGDG